MLASQHLLQRIIKMINKTYTYKTKESMKIKKNQLEAEGYQCYWLFDTRNQEYNLFAYYCN